MSGEQKKSRLEPVLSLFFAATLHLANKQKVVKRVPFALGGLKFFCPPKTRERRTALAVSLLLINLVTPTFSFHTFFEPPTVDNVTEKIIYF